MLVVSDTTPIIALIKAERLGLLEQLFGEIIIPEAVYSELTASSAYRDEVNIVDNSSYIKVVEAADKDYVANIQKLTGLDLGESEAIAYAEEVHADYLLMDERLGRKVARNADLRIMGSSGILVNACLAGYITREEAALAFQKMREANQYISEKVIQQSMNLIDNYAMHGEDE